MRTSTEGVAAKLALLRTAASSLVGKRSKDGDAPTFRIDQDDCLSVSSSNGDDGSDSKPVQPSMKSQRLEHGWDPDDSTDLASGQQAFRVAAVGAAVT